MKFVLSVLAVLITFCSASAVSGVPGSLTYQGRLLDSSGVPVPDGAYLIQFRLYDAPTAGRELWNSSFRQIEISNGLFSYNLGDTVAIRSDLFSAVTDMFLGIKIGTEAELLPRIRLTSSGFAFQAFISDSAQNAMMLEGQPAGYYLDWNNLANIPAGFADGVDDIGLDRLGDTLRGDLVFDGDGDGIIDGGIILFNDIASLELGTAGQIKSRLTGQNRGQLTLFKEDGLFGVDMLATNLSGGWLTLANSAGGGSISLKGNDVGDASVVIPDNAINSMEMLDEPGIAANHSAVGIVLPKTTTHADIITTTITIPSPGYIVVEAVIALWFRNSTTRIVCPIQIDETSGGVDLSSYAVWAGVASVPGAPLYQSVPVSRTYFKTTGTYTFRIEGRQHTGDGGSDITAYNSSIKATYYPTSYGSVTTVAGQPGDHPEAKQVTITDPDGNTHTAYKMDLRYYEEKARVAKIAKQKAELAEATAELELARAKATAENK